MKKIIILLLVLTFGVSAQAASWNFLTEWGHPTMPVPTWQYGYGHQNNYHEFILFPYAGTNGAGDPYWGPDSAAPDNGPIMWRNDESGVSYGIQPGEVAMHTGATGHYLGGWEDIAVRWTAPATITQPAVNLDGKLGAGHGGDREFWVVKNAGQASELVLFHQPSIAGDIPFNVDVVIAAGDTIDFVQGAGAGMGAENSPFDVTITEISPPSEPVVCVLQLDAGTGLTDPNTDTPYGDGDIVGRWQDTQPGHAMQAYLAWGGPTLETNEINGKNVIRFTGEDGLVIDPNSDPDDLLNAPNFTIYVVGRINDLALSQVFYANYSDPAAGAAVGISDSRVNTPGFSTAMGGTVTALNADQELVEGRYFLIAVTKDWLSEKKIYINGELAATGIGKALYNANTITSIGALDIGREFLTGDIAEIRVYNGVDAALQITVTADLIAKYNIDTTPVVPDPTIISLTAMTLTRTGPTGGMDINERWNTLFFDGAWDLALYEGDLITNPALYDPNHPDGFWLNNLTHMLIDIPLRLGEERTFNWHCARGLTDVPKMGVNLFFDSSQNEDVPGISVYAQMDDTGPGDGHPPFLANSAASTMGWPITSTPGSGSLIYYDIDKQMKVTMTDFVIYHPDVYSLDFVSAQYQNPTDGIHPVLGGNDGVPDLIGRFTLKVGTLDCSTLDHFAGDIDGNCRVNLEDIVLLLADWLKCNDPENAGCTEAH